MSQNSLTFDWPDADSTARTATALGGHLHAGDIILLSGPVGGGKTHFARALIQSLVEEPEDVPSPTFTLVQTYDTQVGALWHADLYRISTDTEIDELGLTEAFDEAVCLIEWPDRLGPLTPASALSIDIAMVDDGRRAHCTWTDPRWQTRLAEMVQHV